MKINYSLELSDGTVVTNVSGEPVAITVDDSDIIPGSFVLSETLSSPTFPTRHLSRPAGFDPLIKSMKKGEVSSFTIAAKHAFGAQGHATLNVPANADLKVGRACNWPAEFIDVHITSIVSRVQSHSWTLSTKNKTT